jgi:hypothetical protein
MIRTIGIDLAMSRGQAGEPLVSTLGRQERVSEETERRAAKQGTLSLHHVLQAFTRDADRHTTGGPASEADLQRLQSSLGHQLPASLRLFLLHLGGGLFFHGHEIFGPRRVMIHDIELVPDMLSVRDWLSRTRGLPEGLVPFHRARGVIHVLNLKRDDQAESVIRLGGPEEYPSLAAFLETVVLPRPQV